MSIENWISTLSRMYIQKKPSSAEMCNLVRLQDNFYSYISLYIPHNVAWNWTESAPLPAENEFVNPNNSFHTLELDYGLVCLFL